MELDTKQSDFEVNYHSETNNFKPFYGSYPGNIHGDSTSSTTTQFAQISNQDIPSVNSTSEICTDCFFWKSHNLNYPSQHKSCICELFGNQAICCLEGYSNLIWKIPYMILYAPSPNKYIYHTLNPYILPIQLKSNQVIDIVHFCNNLKLNIIPTLKFPYENQTFIINQEDD